MLAPRLLGFAVAVTLSLSLLAAPAQAAPVTFSFSGTITGSSDPSISSGDPFSGTFTVDSAAPDLDSHPDYGWFQFSGSAYGFVTEINGVLFNSTTTAVNVFQYSSADFLADYQAVAGNASEGNQILRFFAGPSLLPDPNVQLLTAPDVSNLPPIDPIHFTSPFSYWVFTRADGTYIDGAFSVVAVPSPVPEPATLSLLGVGLAGAAVRRFRKRR